MITIVGYDGSPLSPEGAKALADARLVVAGRRHLEGLGIPDGPDVLVLGALDPAEQRIQEAVARGDSVVVLASGDPGFFGIVRRFQALPAEVVVHPAVSSVAAAFGRLGLPWDDAVVVSAHGRPLRPALNLLRRWGGTTRSVAVLTDPSSSPARIVEELEVDCPVLHVLERLGEQDEAHTVLATAQDRAAAVERTWREPNLVVSPGHPTPAMTTVLGQAEPQPWALPDGAFAHRDGMLTKREVRAVVLARLAPAPGTLVWDLGAGSGSVGIECSRLGAAVIAVEQGDVDHLRANADALAGPVRVVQGRAPEALQGLPYPDAVFVGGGGPEVVAAVAAVRPLRVVVALATLERVAPTVAALQGYDVDTVLLQVQHLQPLGDGTRLAPANPVFVVSGALP